MAGERFNPATVTVAAGTTVTWNNDDGASHTVTASSGAFDSGTMRRGAIFTFTFTTPGTFSYVCNFHGGMRGTVNVTGGGGSTPSPTPTQPPPPTPTAPPPPPPAANEVRMLDFSFSPGAITVSAGTSVKWTNLGTAPHTASADDGSFDSDIVARNGSYSFTFTTAGTFPYICLIHPAMTGTITVTGGGGGGGGTPTPTPTAPPPPPPPPPGAVAVEMKDFEFTPKTLTVSAGTKVAWTNTGRAPHTATADNDSFDSGIMAQGDIFTHTFATAGTYTYLCVVHPNMTGTITVTGTGGGGGGGTPSPTATATPPPAPAGANEVQIVDFAFAPQEITVNLNTTVVWTNTDRAPHTVTGGGFDSGQMAKGQTFSRAFSTAGAVSYICALHPGMTGTVLVRDAAGTAPDAPAPASNSGSVSVPPPPPPAANEVQVVNFTYEPQRITVSKGTTVTWRNFDFAPHSITEVTGEFDSGAMSGPYKNTFLNAGTYDYFCVFHPNMKGQVVVTGADGAAGPTRTPTTTAAPGAGEVAIIDFDFTPQTLTVAAGTTVKFTNVGVAPHTATARDKSFDSGNMVKGDIFRYTFTRAGTFEYLCVVHPQMVGTVVVTGDDGSAPPAAAPPQGLAVGAGEVSMLDFDFSPAVLTVAAGTTVKFTNDGVAPHTATARDRSFDSGNMASGDVYRHTFANPGTFPYICAIHPQMTGTIVVTGADGLAPPPNAVQAVIRTSGAPGEVQVLDFAYSPQSVTVRAGSAVSWLNAGVAPHTVTAIDGSFDSGIMASSDRYRRTFNAAGTFSYYCIVHPDMKATVRVTDADGIVPPAGDDGTALPGSEIAAPQPSGPRAAGVAMTDNAFEPRALKVAPGTRVTWRNTGAAVHSVTERNNAFDSGLVRRGESYERTFETLGTIEYYCTIHPTMTGTITVTDEPITGGGGETTGGRAQALAGIQTQARTGGTTLAPIFAAFGVLALFVVIVSVILVAGSRQKEVQA